MMDKSDREPISRPAPAQGEDLAEDVVLETRALEEANERLRHEIAERNRVEEALRLSEMRYRSLVEVSPDVVALSDLEGRLIVASRQAWTLLGLDDDDDLRGTSIFDWVVEEDRPRLAANLTDVVLRNVRRNTEYTMLGKQGQRIAVEASSSVILDANGRPQGAMAVIRDIRTRREAELALRQSYGELRAIYEGLTDGLMIIDLQTLERVQSNTCAAEMLGYRPEELPRSLAALHSPEEYAKIEVILPAKLETGGAIMAENVPFLRKDGTTLYADVSGTCMDYHGRSSAICFVRDVTDRKWAQETLERERQTLRHMVRASDHERQLIAYEIHDELAQRLAAAIMQFQAFEPLREANPEEAKTAYDAGMQMLRQAHAETRRLISGVRPPILDESGITAAIAHLVHDEREASGLEIEFDSRVAFDRLPPVLENVIYRIAQASLSNACQHSGSPRIRVSLIQEGGTVVLEVQDWGCGFDLAAVGEDRYGLEGIRERARLLGGLAMIESQPGRGTLIRAALPLGE